MEILSKIYILLVLYTAQTQGGKDMCDLRMWYLTLVSDDVFNKELTTDMLKLKQSIETLVLNSDASESGKTECHVLDMYNMMLKEKFGYDYAGKYMAAKQKQQETDSQVNEMEQHAGVKADEKQDGENKRDPVKSDNGDQHTVSTGDAAATAGNNANAQKLVKETSGFDLETQKNASDNDNVNDANTDHNKSYEQTHTDTPSKSENNAINEATEEDETDIDETDILEDDSEEDSDNKDENYSQESDADDTADTNKDVFTTRSIPIGVCWSFGCLQSDVFDVFGLDDLPRGNTNDEEQPSINQETKEYSATVEATTQLKQTSGQTSVFQNCYSKKKCNYRCFYIFSNRLCIPGYSDEINKKEIVENKLKEVKKNAKENQESDNSEMKEKSQENTNGVTDSIHSEESKQPSSLNTEVDSKENKEDKVSSTEQPSNPKQENTESQLSAKDVNIELKTKHANEHSDTGQEPENNVKEVEHKGASLFDDIKEVNSDDPIQDVQFEPKTKNDNEHSDTGKESKPTGRDVERKDASFVDDIKEINSKLDDLEKMSKTSIPQNEQNIPIEEFEKLIHKTTKDYAQKIQGLELMIMKLENQLLVEKLNKQNHSSTITRLENLILKLENDFLKLNTQYDEMKTENENVSKRQNHYLEIAYKNKQETCKKLALPDHSAKTSELLSQHQSKITELADILRNQSSFITAIKDRYDSLENQNRMMHQMIMNQTVFMTSIIQTMQDLTTQNSKNREEIETLKERLENKVHHSQENTNINVKKDNIIEAIDKYAVDDKISMNTNDLDDENDTNDTNEDDADVNLKLYLERKSTEQIITQWCPAFNDSCPVCHYRNILTVNCVPFRNLFWGSCGAHCNNRPVIQESLNEVKSETLSTKESHVNNANKDNESTVTKNKGNQNEEKPKKVNEDKSITKDENSKLPEKGIDIPKNKLEETKSDKTIKDENENINKDENENINKDEDKHINKDEGKNINNSNESVKESKDVKDSIKKNIGIKDEHISKEKAEMNRKETLSGPISNTEGGAKDDKMNVDETPKLDKNEKANDKNIKDSTKQNESVKEQPKQANGKLSDKDNAKKGSKEQQNKQNGKSKDKKAGDNKAGGSKKKTPINLTTEARKEPRDCYDYYQRGNKRDGIFKINPVGMDKMIEVFCDMKNGGWTVIQRRQDGTMKFFLEWNDYKKGFGGLYGEHWIGNDKIHLLTNQNYYKLRVDLMDWDKNKKYAEYDYFLVENEENGYRMNIDGYSGDAGDGLSKHHSQKFSTKDVDNDKVVKEFGGSCAKRFHGAGWYYKCYASNLNGKYYKGGKIPEKQYDGVTWKPWTGPNYSLKKVEMKVRPVTAK